MEQNAQNNIHGHYTAQNREEVGAAISKYTSQLNAEQFGKTLDVYDKDKKHLEMLSSVTVLEPLKMIEKLKAQKKNAGLRECCDFLNTLIGKLPRT